MSDPARYQYSCSKCGGPVTKPKTGTSKSKPGVKEKSKLQYGLHGWRCAKCGPVSVKRKSKGERE